ncbi:MAG: hypothetical protein H6550_04220 [Chitinophagales bacterium]|nr:hypothetical protein [Chitinophagales bacterium]
MKYILFALALPFALSANAQNEMSAEQTVPVRKNEIGLLGDPGISGYDPQSYNSIQYKRWVKPNHMAWRANVGYGKYSQYNHEIIFPSLGDTSVVQHSISDIPQVYAGIGAEMQRHFYKKVYMYAAVDLYATYGKGSTKDVLDLEVTDNNNASIFRNQSLVRAYDATRFSIGVLPFVGVKLQFSRISFGTELTGIRMQYSSVNYSAKPSDGGLVDFDMGNFTQRVFINFRF